MATDGYVDGIQGGGVLGWAFDHTRPQDRVELEVVLDGETVGSGVADVAREDLLRHDIGDGRHGFRLQLPRPLVPGGSYRLAVRSVRDGTVLPLVEEYLAQAGSDPEAEPITLRTDFESEPERPVVGAAGWLFAGGDRRRLARVLGQAPAGPAWAHDQLARLRREDERLSRMNIDYLLASLPPKASVYADRLDDSPALGEGRPAAQLAAAMRDEQRLELLDLLDPLREARRHGRTFSRTGGLTWLGAFHAYRAVAKELAKRHPRI